MSVFVRLSNWISGWRLDPDGWWVRAIRATDPEWDDHPEIGFSEEASIVVRTPEQAYDIDRGWFPKKSRPIARFASERAGGEP